MSYRDSYATPAQARFVESLYWGCSITDAEMTALLAEVGVSAQGYPLADMPVRKAARYLTKAEASELIDRLKAWPR